MYECHIQVLTGYQPRTTCMYNLLSQGQIIFGQTPESGIPPSYRATSRYTKVHLGFCLRFSTLIGQIGSVPLFGAGPRRYIRSRLFRLAVTAFWRAFTASWRQKGKRKQIFPRAVRTTELPPSFAPDISEQPDPNLTDLFDTRNHGSQRLSARYPEHTRDAVVTRTHQTVVFRYHT